jgi:hypothetical protein
VAVDVEHVGRNDVLPAVIFEVVGHGLSRCNPLAVSSGVLASTEA